MYNKFILQAIPRVISSCEYSSGIKKSGGFVYSMPPERRTDKMPGCIELISCLDGAIACDMYDVTLEKGQLLCLPSEVSVRLKAVKTPWRYTSLIINAEANILRVDSLDHLLRDSSDASVTRYPTVVFPTLITDVSTVESVNCCVKKLAGRESPSANSSMLADVELLIRIFSAITEYTEASVRKYTSDASSGLGYYETVVRYIDEHITEKLSVGEIADAAEISYGHLTRVIKKASGLSIVELINKMKLDEVQKLLKNTDLTLTEAGKLVGIDDGKYLSRMFKKYYGITYSDFKRKM